jgi:hypothetical protein
MAQRPKSSTPAAKPEELSAKPKVVRGFDLSTPAGRSAYKRSLPKGGEIEDKKLTEKLRAEAAAQVHDTEHRRSGRPKGLLNQKTIEKKEMLTGAMKDVFASLTAAEIEAIKPIDVFRLVTIAAVKAADHVLAMTAADKWAPYVHAKLAPIQVDTSNGVKRIIVENAPEGDDE